MKITQADAPTIRMDCHIRLIGAPTAAIPTIFTLDALPGTTLPIHPGLGEEPKMLGCIPGGLVAYPEACWYCYRTNNYTNNSSSKCA